MPISSPRRIEFASILLTDLRCHAEPKAKHLGSEPIIRKLRFFTSPCFAQNDKCGVLLRDVLEPSDEITA